MEESRELYSNLKAFSFRKNQFCNQSIKRFFLSADQDDSDSSSTGSPKGQNGSGKPDLTGSGNPDQTGLGSSFPRGGTHEASKVLKLKQILFKTKLKSNLGLKVNLLPKSFIRNKFTQDQDSFLSIPIAFEDREPLRFTKQKLLMIIDLLTPSFFKKVGASNTHF